LKHDRQEFRDGLFEQKGLTSKQIRQQLEKAKKQAIG